MPVNSRLDIPIGIILDTQGPEIRLGVFREKKFLKEGADVTITTRDIECDEKVISVSYKKLPQTVKPNDFIFISDGTIELKVKKISGTDVLCEVVMGGEVSTKKNVSIPGAYVDLPALGEKDIKDIEFGATQDIDFVAQSFTKTAQDVLDMKAILKKYGSDALVIAKIEEPLGLKNIDEIIEAADGIMVARGDLGVQIPIEQVANAQKMIIRKCDCSGKPVIVATQMLESMTKSPRPTRAEVTDVANAILDGADAIMLSGETAAGLYPIRALDMMVKIAVQTESKIDYASMNKCIGEIRIDQAISRSVCQLANELKASAIIPCTFSGHTARIISRYRPLTPIIAVTPNIKEIRKLNLSWGVVPYQIPGSDTSDQLVKDAIDIVKKKEIVKKGDIVILTAGIPFFTPGNTNLVKVETVE